MPDDVRFPRFLPPADAEALLITSVVETDPDSGFGSSRPVAILIEARVPVLGWCAPPDDHWNCPDMRCPYPVLQEPPYGCLVLVLLADGQILRPGTEDRWPDVDQMYAHVLGEMQAAWDCRYATS
jgi:hypothetical protein